MRGCEGPLQGSRPVRRHSISADDAIAQLRRGEPLREVTVEGALDLRRLCVGDRVELPIRFESCQLTDVSGVFAQFVAPFELVDTELNELACTFAYFAGGLRIDGCTFASAVDFQCGGHNSPNRVVSVTRSTFRAFVNFFDCWFEGPVPTHARSLVARATASTGSVCRTARADDSRAENWIARALFATLPS